ncbi:MAG: tripartite tricarboxylate transporter permease [Deltaproteobacteria bacterium]|nr:tripartite tricarboxylate transporter permease [Deltaproteobacteria bacterium]
MLENFALGLDLIMQWQNFLAIVIGASVGLLFGSIPGLTGGMAIAMLMPLTFEMPFITAIMLFIGLYKGGTFGGAITAILLNTPGTAASACTVLDGFPLTQQGKSGKALKMAKYASCLADTASDLVLIAVAAPLASIALKFGPPEIAVLIFFSLTIIASVSGDSMIKGLISGSMGLLVATVGLDPVVSTRRFCFDNVNLDGGLSLIPVLVGLFCLPEIFTQIGRRSESEVDKYTIPTSSNPADNRVSWAEFKTCLRSIVRGTAIGTAIGTIPGIGVGIGAFISYARAKQASRNPELFGKGSLEGIAASESGNSAVVGATFIPLLTIGIPGDSVTAIIMGAFLVAGLIPGPMLFQESPDIIYAIFVGLLICDAVYYVLGTIFMKYLRYLGRVPRRTLFSILFIFCMIGAYAMTNSIFDIGVVIVFGILGYYMLKFNFATAPFLIAFILGPIGEKAFQRALLMSDGSLAIFVTRPISLAFFILTILSLIGIIRGILKKRRKACEPEPSSEAS